LSACHTSRSPFPIGQGSVWRSLLHLYAAEYVWLEALLGNEESLVPGDVPGKLPGNQEGGGGITGLADLQGRWASLERRWAGYLAALTPEQRQKATFAFPAEDERRRWYYTPTDHGGLPLAELNPPQQQRLHQLVASGLSMPGYATAAPILGLENVLGAVAGRLVRFARPHARLIAVGFCLTLASTAAGLVPPYLTMPLLDRVLIPHQNGVPADFSILPDLAEKWTVSKDGKVYTPLTCDSSSACHGLFSITTDADVSGSTGTVVCTVSPTTNYKIGAGKTQTVGAQVTSACLSLLESAPGNTITGNKVIGNRFGKNNTLGDWEDTSTTGVFLVSNSPMAIDLVDNTIAGDVYGIYEAGPVGLGKGAAVKVGDPGVATDERVCAR